MMYVKTDDDIRNFIRYGQKSAPVEGDVDGDHDEVDGAGHDAHEIKMPAYGNRLDDGEVEDLVAAFRVLSRMSPPPSGSAAKRGLDLSRKWQCESCHGAGASGGLPNPGSFAGFIPGWYGADFRELVKDREEFDTWIRDGRIPRLAEHPIASRFIRAQQISMPGYEILSDRDLDDLWSYTEWLAEMRGGIDAPIKTGW